MKYSKFTYLLLVGGSLLNNSEAAESLTSSDGMRSRLELIDATNPAATFKVRVQSATGQTTFKMGENAVLELQSDIDTHVIVLTRDPSGAIVQLWPNEWSPAATLKKTVSTL